VKKLLYLNQVEKANKVFLREWRKLAADLTALDQEEDGVPSLEGERRKLINKSPLYHLYHIGSEEISHRTQKSKRGFDGLSGRSIQAIQASLDSGALKEQHKLNGGLVFLTISIAGGPYVGLLGTVMGVMITFAIIAKSGEVDVNSIAPGIASALLATVAGLIVAIPALFIYSYLASRIKQVMGELQMFIDEFITKMAEFYKEAK
jgi:biopolymer transport protein ExbB